MIKVNGFLRRSKTCPFYTWESELYREFMLSVLGLLEPRYEKSGNVIYKQVEEVEEMFFVMSGSINVGFEYNRAIKNVVRL